MKADPGSTGMRAFLIVAIAQVASLLGSSQPLSSKTGM
jgi:hypothetical protein